MTDRLWNYLETYFNTPNSDSFFGFWIEHLEIETDLGKFVVEPIYDCYHSEIIDFTVYHGSYWTTVSEEPDIWFWKEIEKNLLEREN